MMARPAAVVLGECLSDYISRVVGTPSLRDSPFQYRPDALLYATGCFGTRVPDWRYSAKDIGAGHCVNALLPKMWKGVFAKRIDPLFAVLAVSPRRLMQFMNAPRRRLKGQHGLALLPHRHRVTPGA